MLRVSGGLSGQVAVPAEVKTQVMKHAALLDVDLLCLLDLLAPEAVSQEGSVWITHGFSNLTVWYFHSSVPIDCKF